MFAERESERPIADVAVVFVHGIGEQRKGDVLARWGDALVTWTRVDGLNRSTGFKDPELAKRVLVEPAGARLHQSDEPAHTLVRGDIDGAQWTWLLAESWWAESLVAPRFSELVTWSLWTLPVTLITHVQTSVLRSKEFAETARARAARTSPRGLARSVRRFFVAAVSFMMALALSPLIVVGLLVMLLLGALPTAGLSNLAGRLQRTLARSVGDSLILLDQPIQAAAILHQVRTDIRWASVRSKQTVVIAHSQGAAIVLEVLQKAASCQPGDLESLVEDPSAGSSQGPGTLITFGSGVNKLFELRRVRAAMDRGGGIASLWLAILILYTLAVCSGLVGWLLVTSRLELTGLLLNAGVVIVALAVQQALRWAFGWVSHWPWVEDHEAVRPWLGLIFLVTLLAPGVWLGAVLDVHPFVVWLFITAFLISGIVNQLYRGAPEAQTVDLPAGLKTWLDVYSARDPVPNGPTRVQTHQHWSGTRSAREITNVQSRIRDHSWYWNNTDEFVPLIVEKVMRCCRPKSGQDAASNPKRSEPQEVIREALRESASTARRNRVGQLSFGRFFLVGSAVTYIAQHRNSLNDLGDEVKAWVDAIAGWLPGSGVLANIDSGAVGLLALVAAAVAGNGVLTATWTLYDRASQRARAMRRPVSGWTATPFVFVVIALLASVALIDQTVKWATVGFPVEMNYSGPTPIELPMISIWITIAISAIMLSFVLTSEDFR